MAIMRRLLEPLCIARKAGISITALGLVLVSAGRDATAEYVEAENVISVSTDQEWLYEATAEGVKKGAEAVTNELLTSLAKVLIESYSPAISELFFGGGNELEQHTRQIIEAVDRSHANLAQRHRDLLAEVMTQFSVDVEGDVVTASSQMRAWLASDDVLQRIASKEVMNNAQLYLEDARNTIELYISDAATPSITFRRLQLAEIHAVAARLQILASRYYYSTVAIETAFQRSGLGDPGLFDAWLAGLSAAERAELEEMIPQFHTTADQVHRTVVSFYNNIAAQAPVRSFLNDKVTPPVSHVEVFLPSSAFFDDPAVVTDRASWGLREGAGSSPILDGVRWYYYANIPAPPGPGAECVEGYAFEALEVRDVFPWAEVAARPAASECNRFWIVDPNLNSSGWPNSNLASFDGYSVWFPDGNEAHDLHKRLLRGDILRALYGPISLLLDEMHMSAFGFTRQNNAWDDYFNEFEEYVTMLGFASSLTDGVDWGVLRDGRALMSAWGGSRRQLGLRDWDRALTVLVGDFQMEDLNAARMALELVGRARSAGDWMFGVRRAEPFQLPPDDIRLALIGPQSVFARLAAGEDEEAIRSELEARFRREAGAKFAAVR